MSILRPRVSWARRSRILYGAICVCVVASVKGQEPTYSFSLLAGSPTGGLGNADGQGSAAAFAWPGGLAIDAQGNLYVGDVSNDSIRKITAGGMVTTLAGFSGRNGYADGVGVAAKFNQPKHVAVDLQGNVYVAEDANAVVRKITPTGEVSTLAGLAGHHGYEDGLGSAARFSGLKGIAVDRAGTVYVSVSLRTIRAISPQGVVTTIAGRQETFESIDGAGLNAGFGRLGPMAFDADQNLYIIDGKSVRKMTPERVVTTLAGHPTAGGLVNATGTAARFGSLTSIACDAQGNVIVSDWDNSLIRKISPAGVVTTWAGVHGQTGSNNGSLQEATFEMPLAVTVDATGNGYVAEQANSTIRKISVSGEVSTFAGAINLSGSADGIGPAARFTGPTGVAVDSAGTIYIADRDNHVIRRVVGSAVTTLAGVPRQIGSTDGVGSAARFYYPTDVAVDRSGNVYVLDMGNSTIRKVTPSGMVTTLAGSAGSLGSNDGVGASARFGFTGWGGIAMSPTDVLFVADGFGCMIRTVLPDGTVTTYAGKPGVGITQDGTRETATFSFTQDVAVDSKGNVFVAEGFGHALRKIAPDGKVTTVAGHPEEFGTNDGPALEARFRSVASLAVDQFDNLLISDSGNYVIRRMTPGGSVSTIGGFAGYAGMHDGVGADARFGIPAGLAVGPSGTLYVADRHYNAVRQGVASTTGPSVPAVEWASPAPILSGTPLSARQLNATSSVPGAFTYSQSLGTILAPGTHVLTVTFTPADLANYSSVTKQVSVTVAASVTTTRLVALAARAAAGSGDQTLIMGFVVEGNKEVLVQGVGPGIAGSVPTALADPRLELFRYQGGTFAKVDENNDWVNSSAITEARARLGASALAVGSKDAALLKTISGGVYTAHVASGGAAGVALVEAYDADGGGSSRLMALSTRTVAGAGDATLIAGFVLEGNGPKTVLIRGLGPELALRGVQGVLADPKITVYRGSNVVGSNDDWGGSAELKETFTGVGAEQLASNTSKDAAMLVTLDPGAYTVHVTGSAGTTGVALVEIFDVP